MSIYVIRYGDLLKIGYSSDLAARVRAILWGIPGKVATFVGHMPGDLEVEAHLHLRFEASRFSGEWFRETDELLAFCEIVLTKELPAVAPRVTGSRKAVASAVSLETRQALREYAANRWPAQGQEERVKLLNKELGWLLSRTKSFYHGDYRAVLRASEADQIRELALHRPGITGDDE